MQAREIKKALWTEPNIFGWLILANNLLLIQLKIVPILLLN